MGLGIGLNCCCVQCEGFCNDAPRAVILVTISGITGTPVISDGNCPTCGYFNKTYPLTFRPTGEPYYSLLCGTSEEQVEACLYAYRENCEAANLFTLHFLAYTTPGGDRRGYLEVRYFSGSTLWAMTDDFLMASGSTSLDCLSFTQSNTLTECTFTGTVGVDCQEATDYSLTIEAA